MFASRLRKNAQDTPETPDEKTPEEASYPEKPQRRFRVDRDLNMWTWRGLTNLGSLVLFTVCLILFL